MTEKKIDHLGMAHYVLHTLCDMLAARVSLAPHDSHARAVHALAWHALDLTSTAMTEPAPAADGAVLYPRPIDRPFVSQRDVPAEYSLTSAQAAERLDYTPQQVGVLAACGVLDAVLVFPKLPPNHTRKGTAHGGAYRISRESVEVLYQAQQETTR